MLDHLYGKYPKSLSLEVIAKNNIETPDELAGAQIEIWSLNVTTESDSTGRPLDFVLVKPSSPNASNTVILAQTFCPINNVAPFPGVPAPENVDFNCEGGGFFSGLMHYFFGRYIVSPPFKDILSEGYAIGILYPSQYIADSPERARKEIDQAFAHLPPDDRPGALMIWAALSVQLSGELSMDYDSIAAWGHSRYGKTAILAGVATTEIDGVIAHQSGTAGASLSQDKPGETLADLAAQYPHWLGRSARDFANTPEALPFDQHHLLAALAPKPLLLGNARRDVWSDPEGAFRAALAANDIYGLYGSDGLTAERLNEFNPADEISFWIRPGTHGVVEEDWPAFLAFLKAHFP